MRPVHLWKVSVIFSVWLLDWCVGRDVPVVHKFPCLKMEVVYSSETLIAIYVSIQRVIPTAMYSSSLLWGPQHYHAQFYFCSDVRTSYAMRKGAGIGSQVTLLTIRLHKKLWSKDWYKKRHLWSKTRIRELTATEKVWKGFFWDSLNLEDGTDMSSRFAGCRAPTYAA